MIELNQICIDFPDVHNIKFTSESGVDPSRKTFLLDDVIIKSRKLDDDRSTHLRSNNIKQEYDVLNLSDAIEGVPKALHFNKNEIYELLFLSYLPGVQLRNLQLSFFSSVIVTFRVFKILFNLSTKGVCHNDVIPQNVLITENNKASLFDSYQAVVTTFFKAFAGNIFGITSGESIVSYRLNTILKDYLRKNFPKFLYLLRKLMSILKNCVNCKGYNFYYPQLLSN